MTATNAGSTPNGELFLAFFVGGITLVLAALALFYPIFLYLGLDNIEAAYRTVTNALIHRNGPTYLIPNFDYILLAVEFFSALIAIAAGVWTYIATTPPREIHISGRKLLDDKAAVKAWGEAMDAEEKWGEEGIQICETPDGDTLYISQDRETKHVLVAGGIGSGKTTIMRPRIDAAIERGDQVLVFDNKSDFTASVSNWDAVILVAPWDSRGWAWDVAYDVQNRSDAEALADSIISANDKDPMWSNAARAVLTAIIIRCQHQLPKKWSWGHITKIMESDAEIQKTVKKFTPEFSALVSDMESKTTVSILVNLIAFLRPIFTLADAWDRCPTAGKFSIKRWIHSEGIESEKRTIVIQGNGAFESLQIALTQSLISAIKREATSPRVTDVRPSERRINLFLDEFKQMGRLEGFDTLLEVARSKGFRLTVAVQDIQQIFEIYGKEKANTWLSNFGIYVIGRLQGGETTKWLSDMIGKKRIKVYSPSYSSSYQDSTSRTDSYQEQDRAVVQAEEFSRLLGTHETGARIMLFTGDDNVYVVDAKHLTSEQKGQKRPPTEAAAWTEPSWPSAADVAVAQQLVTDAEAADDEE